MKPITPEMLEALRKEGKTLLQVTKTELYLLEGEDHRTIPALMHEWFVDFNGKHHIYRESSHIGGGDTVQEIKNLTDEGKVVFKA